MNYGKLVNNPHEGVFLILALVIYFIFRVLQYILNKYPDVKRKQFLGRVFYFIEIVAWFVYLSNGVLLFASKNMVVSGLCSLILILATGWVAWYILRDFLAGLFLKMDGSLKPGEIIEFNGDRGEITGISNLFLVIENESAKRIKIPFHQFYSKRFIHTGVSENCAWEVLFIRLKPEKDVVETVEEIKLCINQLPWTNTRYEAEVSVEEDDADNKIVKINAALFDKKYLAGFRNHLRKRFE